MATNKIAKPARLLLILLVSCSFPLLAQNAEVHGTVHDSAGAAITNATVELRNQDTGVRRRATTLPDGSYRIENIDPGSYDAIVQARGYKTLTLADIDVQSDRSSRVDFQLELDADSRRAHFSQWIFSPSELPQQGGLHFTASKLRPESPNPVGFEEARLHALAFMLAAVYSRDKTMVYASTY